MSDHKSMDKILGQNIIKQDSILCNIQPEILKIISECLPPNDVAHLSHTCKDLHQELPFYLKKSGTFIILPLLKVYSLLKGPPSNFCISQITIPFIVPNSTYWVPDIAVWIHVIRQGIAVLKTQK